MIRIPDFYKVEMDFTEAADIIKRGNSDLLDSMETFQKRWNDHCINPEMDDDEFFDKWCYEVSAYNVVFDEMSRFFA